MEELIKRSYSAIVNRGLITPKTGPADFCDKIDEEVAEVNELVYMNVNYDDDPDCTIGYDIEDKDKYVEELTDLATVCFMQIKHLGYDPIKEFEKVVLKNERRADEQ